MGSLLEKITLYDILGYTLPGCVLLLLILSGIDTKYICHFWGQWNKSMEVFYFIFFLTAYLSGIVLSELADTVIGISRKVRIPAPAGWEKDVFLRKQVVNALKKSGYYEERVGTDTTIEEGGLGRYMGYIYGSVQGSTEYTRIHNYASAYVLYKNLAAAFVLGTVFLLGSKGWNLGILVAGAILIALMVKRSIRYYHKKNQYAVVWFVNKYLKEE